MIFNFFSRTPLSLAAVALIAFLVCEPAMRAEVALDQDLSGSVKSLNHQKDLRKSRALNF
jgi:hypothetical protein